MQLNQEVYGDLVRDQAKQLVKDAQYLVDEHDSYDELEDALVDAVTDTLDAFDWFTDSEYGPAAHGAFVEYSDADPCQYRDLTTLTESDDPAEIVRKLAYACFEADVIETARDIC